MDHDWIIANPLECMIFRYTRELLLRAFYRHARNFLLFFFDKIFYSNGSLKLLGQTWFFKIGFPWSILVSKEIENIRLIQATFFRTVTLPYRIVNFCPCKIIKCPRVEALFSISNNQLIELLVRMETGCEQAEIKASESWYVRRLTEANILDAEEISYVETINFRASVGPIHGDFHRKNIVRFQGHLCLIDLDFFEIRGIHHFDYINLLVSDLIFDHQLSWHEAIERLSLHPRFEPPYPAWIRLHPIEKSYVFYLYFLWRLSNELFFCGFSNICGHAGQVSNIIRKSVW